MTSGPSWLRMVSMLPPRFETTPMALLRLLVSARSVTALRVSSESTKRVLRLFDTDPASLEHPAAKSGSRKRKGRQVVLSIAVPSPLLRFAGTVHSALHFASGAAYR